MSPQRLILLLGLLVVLCHAQKKHTGHHGHSEAYPEKRNLPHSLAKRLPFPGFGSGIDGPTCGPFNRKCIQFAQCVGGKCVCPGGRPNGYIDCVANDWFQCSVIGDPHIDSFGSSLAMINIPCRYKLAEFRTPVARTLVSFCETTVFGKNIYRNGRFYADKMDVSLKITRGFPPNRNLEFEVDRDGVTIKDGFRDDYVSWGSTFQRIVRGVIVRVTFDTVQNFVVITAPRCDVRVLLRPVDLGSVRQSRAPGIAISSKSNSRLSFLTTYPKALCGTDTDLSTLYSSRISVLGLDDENAVIIYDWLNNPVSQDGDDRVQCTTALSNFAVCGARKSGAVDLCAEILNNRRLNECLATNSVNVMTTFQNCITGYCLMSRSNCLSSTTALAPCASFASAAINDQNCGSYPPAR